MDLRSISDAFRRKFSIPYVETHAAILAAALFHPVTGAALVYLDSSGALVSPSGSLGAIQIVTTSTPTTGGTVTFGTAKSDELLNLTPAGTLAALTVTFPTNTNSRIGQVISVRSSQIVTALTLSASGLTLNDVNTPAGLQPNVTYRWQKVAASTWVRLANSDPTTIQRTRVTITNAQMLALRGTPKTLVAAPGAGYLLQFLGAQLIFNYTGAYTETTDNMAVKYVDGSGAAVSETIEATGFVDATADTITNARPKLDAIIAAAGAANSALVLHNTGDGEWGGGNAANEVYVDVRYRVIPTGL